jgi:glycosyltransferase involved in cell wall biosynthesis
MSLPKNNYNHERIAIILCTKNGSKFIYDQLRSIQDQTYALYDIHIKDNHSNDNTLAKIKEFKTKNPNISITIHKGDKAHYANSFVRLTNKLKDKYKYYAFCDQDDIWCKNHLERGVNILRTNKNSGPLLVCSRTKLINSESSFIGFSKRFKKTPSFRNALVQSIAGANTMIFNNKACSLLCSINTDLKIVSHDWMLYILVTASGGKVIYISLPSVLYRQHNNNLIGSNRGLISKLSRAKLVFNKTLIKNFLLNIAHLNDYQFIKKNNINSYEYFKYSLDGKFSYKFRMLLKSKVYRQTLTGNIALFVNLFFKLKD